MGKASTNLHSGNIFVLILNKQFLNCRSIYESVWNVNHKTYAYAYTASVIYASNNYVTINYLYNEKAFKLKA